MPRPLHEDDLVLCSGTIARAPLPAAVTIAAAAGFRGLSVYFDDHAAVRAAGWSDAGLRALLDDHDVAVAELDGAMRWLPGDSRGPSSEEFLDVAAALGARSCTVIEVDGRIVGEDRPFAEVVEAFADLCDRAATRGLLVHLEYFPVSGIRDLATAHAIARAAGRPNGGVLLDVFHHTRGPDAGRADLDDAAPLVFAVQVNDVRAEPVMELRREIMHDRLLPGEGAANVAELLRALRAQGCTAPFGVEVYSDDLHALGAGEAAALAARAMRAVLSG
ncbi:MAG: TIM barrel protein [Acidimicrobiia bacterium]